MGTTGTDSMGFVNNADLLWGNVLGGSLRLIDHHIMSFGTFTFGAPFASWLLPPLATGIASWCLLYFTGWHFILPVWITVPVCGSRKEGPKKKWGSPYFNGWLCFRDTSKDEMRWILAKLWPVWRFYSIDLETEISKYWRTDLRFWDSILCVHDINHMVTGWYLQTGIQVACLYSPPFSLLVTIATRSLLWQHVKQLAALHNAKQQPYNNNQNNWSVHISSPWQLRTNYRKPVE